MFPFCSSLKTRLSEVEIGRSEKHVHTGPSRNYQHEIKRMAQAKASFQNMKSILTNKRLSHGVRKRVLQCYIEPILLYGCESWSMPKQTLTHIEAMEMWFLRRMLRVGLSSWTEKRTNLEILNTASSRPTRKLECATSREDKQNF